MQSVLYFANTGTDSYSYGFPLLKISSDFSSMFKSGLKHAILTENDIVAFIRTAI